MFKSLSFASLALAFSVSAFGTVLVSPVSKSDPNLPVYQAALALDNDLALNKLIGTYADYDTNTLFEAGPAAHQVQGRVISLATGDAFNPIDFVLSLNGKIYLVQGRLSSVTGDYHFARRWNGNAGIFLEISGVRRGVENNYPTLITVKLADPTGLTSDAIEVNSVRVK